MNVVTLSLELTPKELEKLTYILSFHEDCGPRGEGWQSDTLESLNLKVGRAVEASNNAFYNFFQSH